jgi:O-acetyl-ADP-ribose deacetylase (regulator of RNase III)
LNPTIKYLLGDATQPRGKGYRIIAHVIQDKTQNWGRGFALAVAKKWPSVHTDFREWVSLDKDNLSLGNSHLSEASEELGVFHMIAQHGYGPSVKPRVRYSALKECLANLAMEVSKRHGSVHMPRIGTGYAMGNWGIIRELIDETLVRKGIEVTVYDLPGRENRPKLDLLDFFSSFD